MTNGKPANDNDDDPPDGAVLLLDDSDDTLTDPGVLGELLAGLRIDRRYLLAREPERAVRFLSHQYNVLIARNGLAGAMPDLRDRLRRARRLFVDAHVGEDALRALAGELGSDQRLSALVRTSDAPIPGDLRCRLASILYIDTAVVSVPPALRRH